MTASLEKSLCEAFAGRFVTVEGPDGAGKSTLVACLAKKLTGQGLTVVQTREPGGSRGGEDIRALLIQGEADRWSPVSECLLLAAARRDHIEKIIRPALAKGAFVLCDRFSDSMWAYQGGGKAVSTEILASLDRIARDGLSPDLTLLIDIDPEAGRGRRADRAAGNPQATIGGDRFESAGSEFHIRVRDAFLAKAREHQDRITCLSGLQAPDALCHAAWQVLEERFHGESA